MHTRTESTRTRAHGTRVTTTKSAPEIIDASSLLSAVAITLFISTIALWAQIIGG